MNLSIKIFILLQFMALLIFLFRNSGDQSLAIMRLTVSFGLHKFMAYLGGLAAIWAGFENYKRCLMDKSTTVVEYLPPMILGTFLIVLTSIGFTDQFIKKTIADSNLYKFGYSVLHCVIATIVSLLGFIALFLGLHGAK